MCVCICVCVCVCVCICVCVCVHDSTGAASTNTNARSPVPTLNVLEPRTPAPTQHTDAVLPDDALACGGKRDATRLRPSLRRVFASFMMDLYSKGCSSQIFIHTQNTHSRCQIGLRQVSLHAEASGARRWGRNSLST